MIATAIRTGLGFAAPWAKFLPYIAVALVLGFTHWKSYTLGRDLNEAKWLKSVHKEQKRQKNVRRKADEQGSKDADQLNQVESENDAVEANANDDYGPCLSDAFLNELRRYK